MKIVLFSLLLISSYAYSSINQASCKKVLKDVFGYDNPRKDTTIGEQANLWCHLSEEPSFKKCYFSAGGKDFNQDLADLYPKVAGKVDPRALTYYNDASAYLTCIDLRDHVFTQNNFFNICYPRQFKININSRFPQYKLMWPLDGSLIPSSISDYIFEQVRGFEANAATMSCAEEKYPTIVSDDYLKCVKLFGHTESCTDLIKQPRVLSCITAALKKIKTDENGHIVVSENSTNYALERNRQEKRLFKLSHECWNLHRSLNLND